MSSARNLVVGLLRAHPAKRLGDSKALKPRTSRSDAGESREGSEPTDGWLAGSRRAGSRDEDLEWPSTDLRRKGASAMAGWAPRVKPTKTGMGV